MKKNLLFMFALLTGFTFLSAQTVVFGDDFESYADDSNLADAGYAVWVGGAVVSDVTIDGGTAVSGDKIAVCQPSGNDYYFRKTVDVEEGKNYTFEAMTKSPGAKNHRIAYKLGTDAPVLAPLVGATEWTKSTLSFTPAAGQTSVILWLYSYPVSTVHLDDFMLTVEDAVNTSGTLTALSIDVGTLVPDFDQFTFDYSAELPAGTTVAPTITATASEAGATVDIVDATDVTSATEADRTSTVTVTGEDGTTEHVYSILFSVAASDDATLSDLSLSVGTLDPAFDAATTAYAAELPYGTAVAPTVTANPTNSNATVVVTDASDVTSATEADRTTTIVVTAEDDNTTETYTIVFSIAPNSDATLSALIVSSGALVPAFDAATTAYSVELAAGTTETPTVTPTPTDANALVDITDATDVTSETEADRTSTIVVTAEDGTTEKTYTVVFSIVDDTPYAYLPVFADDFEGYDAAFNLADTGYIIWEGGATVVEVEGEDAANSGTKYAHLSPSAQNYYFRRPLELEEGADYVFELFTRSPEAKNHRAVAKIGDRSIQGPLQNATEWTKTSIEFTVGAGETSAIFWIYSFPMSRVDLDDFGIYKKVDGSGTLVDLSLDAGTLTPEFEQFTFDYSAELPAGTTTAPTVTADAFEDGATVDVTDATDVTSANEADRTTTVVVTAADGTTQKTYTIVFSIIVSVNEMSAAPFEVYPNPASDQIYFRTTEALASVKITSLNGQVVKYERNSDGQLRQMNIADLEQGFYLVNIKTKAQKSFTLKLIKK
jgi:hypothetical protein